MGPLGRQEQGGSGHRPGVPQISLQKVGCCQAINQVASLLLMFLDKEDAFWALTQLLVGWKHAMHGGWTPDKGG